jgi:DNA-binding transcriptional regulator PaaX
LISLHVDRVEEVENVLTDVPRYSWPSTPGAATCRPWSAKPGDLAGIEDAYRGFLAGFAVCRAGATRRPGLVHAERGFPALDPALPAELLASPWRGTAVEILFRRHASWAAAAGTEWIRLNQNA